MPTEHEKDLELLNRAIDKVLAGAPLDQTRRNYIKARRAAVRTKFSLAADSAITEGLPKWRKEFDAAAMKQKQLPVAPDIAKELGKSLAQ